jgi:arylsulfatase A-like enzyme
MYPSGHGVMHPHDRFPTDVPTLAETLHAAGYRTGAFVGNPTMRAEIGYDRGFDTFHPAPPPRWIHHRKTAIELLATRLSAGGDVSPTRNLVPRALEWLRQDDPRPPFLYLHLIDPHSGYVPPREHFAPFLPEGIEDGPAHPPRLFDYNEDDEWVPWEDLENGPHLTDAELAGMVARYDGEIHYVDMWIGRFLDEVRNMGILDDALVVFLSDHGEEFDDHGGWFHGETLYREMVDMPLLIKLPYGQHGGTRTALSVDMVDLASTLEGWIGLQPAAGRQGQDLSTPLTQILTGEELLLAVQPERVTFTERPPRLAALEWNRFKLIRRTVRGEDRVSLYNLGHDPHEQFDAALEQPELRANMESMLDAFLANVTREGALDREAGDVDPETLRVLRTLGYVE